jgi:hypothetical protein
VSTPEPKRKAPPKILIITRQSAARGQLETAIKLWFSEGDEASIQTLTGNSLQLLHDIGRKPGVNKPSTILQAIDKMTKAQRKRATLAQTFLKHADRRVPYNSIGYAPEIAEHLMFEAVVCYTDLFEEITPLMRLYFVRFILSNPQFFRNEVMPKFFDKLPRDEFARLSRSEFFEKSLALLI